LQTHHPVQIYFAAVKLPTIIFGFSLPGTTCTNTVRIGH
jgi:hypothetical protein